MEHEIQQLVYYLPRPVVILSLFRVNTSSPRMFVSICALYNEANKNRITCAILWKLFFGSMNPTVVAPSGVFNLSCLYNFHMCRVCSKMWVIYCLERKNHEESFSVRHTSFCYFERYLSASLTAKTLHFVIL